MTDQTTPSSSMRERHLQGLMRRPRLTLKREAEIAAAVAAVKEFPDLGTWTAGPRDAKSVLPPAPAYVVEDVLRTSRGCVMRFSVGVFGEEQHAAFTALARTAVGELLAEMTLLRKDLAQAQQRVRELEAGS
jgi:hypothetical protein